MPDEQRDLVDIVAKPKRKRSGPQLETSPNASWRTNLGIQKRLGLVERLMLSGHHESRPMLDQLNAALVQIGQPAVGRKTLNTDIRRIRTMIQEQHKVNLDELVASIEQLKRESWAILSRKSEPALMRSTALREIREQDQLLAKLVGVLDERNVLNVGVKIEPVRLLDTDSPALRAALLILQGEQPKLLEAGGQADDLDSEDGDD
jgi:hypothetical protein